MNWLTRNGIFSLDFTQDVALLKAIAVLDRRLDDDPSDTDLEDVVQGLDALAYGGGEAARVKEILVAAALDPAEIAADWKKLRGKALDILPESYQALGYPLNAFGSAGTPCGSIDWPLVGTGKKTAVTALADLQLAFTGEHNVRVQFEASPEKLPKAFPRQHPRPQVRMGFAAKLVAGTEATLPLRWVAISGNAGANATASFNWYFYNKPSALFATALARDLGRITSPFDLETLAEQTSWTVDRRAVTPKLAALQMQVGGQVLFGGEIELVNPVATTLGSGTISAKLGFQARRSGDFRYLVYNQQGVVLSIYRNKSAAASYTASLGVELNLKPVYREFPLLLKDQLGQIGALLEKLEDALPSDGKLREAVSAKIAATLEDAPGKEFLKALIGFDAERTASEVLADYVLSEVECTAARWAIDVKEAADGVADRVLLRLDVEGPRVEELRKIVMDQAKKAIESEVKRLRKAVEKLGKSDEAQDFTGVLNSLGFGVQTSVSNVAEWVNEVFEPVRIQLTRYQHQVGKLSKILEKAAEAKLQASIYAEEERGTGMTLDAKVRFNEVNRETRSLYKQAMTGALDKVFDAFRAQPAGGPVELIEGALTRVSTLDRKSGYGISLLGLELASARHLDVDVSYVLESDGDIRVTSQGEIKACRDSWKEGRCLSFVNVFSLAAASQTKHLAIDLTLSQNDEDVSVDDLEGFFSALEEGGLLRKGGTRDAIEFFESIEDAQPRAAFKGKLTTGFSLGEENLRALLGIDAAGQTVRRDEDVLGVVVDEILPAAREAKWFFERVIDDSRIRRIRDHFPQYEPALPGNLRDAIIQMDERTWNRARNSAGSVVEDIAGQWTLQEDVDTVFDYHAYAQQLVDMVRTLRAVYFSGKQPGSWNVETYLETQERLDRYLRFWLKVDRKWLFLLPREIRPFTVAFVRILARLAGLPLGGREKSVVSAKLIVGDNSFDLTDVRRSV